MIQFWTLLLVHILSYKAREILLICSTNTSMGMGSERLVVSPYIGQSKGQEFCALPLYIAVKMTQGDEGITKDH